MMADPTSRRPADLQAQGWPTLTVQHLSAAPGEALKHGTPNVRLTPRQLQVLTLLCEGLPNKLICRRLAISAGTTKAHISSILRELGVSSRLQAVVEAGRRGLLGNQDGEASAIDTPTGDPLMMPFNLPERATRKTLNYAYSRN